MVRLREGEIALAVVGPGAKNKSAFPCFIPPVWLELRL